MANYNSQLQGNNINLQSILNAVNSLPEKTQLPTLQNPAVASNISKGRQAIDGSGNVMTGTSEAVVLAPMTNPATVWEIIEGYEAIDSKGVKMIGKYVPESGGAVEKIPITVNFSGLSSLSMSYVTGGARRTKILLSSGTSTNVDKGSTIILEAAWQLTVGSNFIFSKSGAVSTLAKVGGATTTSQSLYGDVLGDGESGTITLGFSTNSGGSTS